MIRVNYNTIASLIFLFVASIALWETKGLSKMSYVFPRAAGAVLFVLSVLSFITSIRKPTKKKAFGDVDLFSLMVIVISFISYLILIAIVGFFLASFLYIALISKFLQRFENKSEKEKMAP